MFSFIHTSLIVLTGIILLWWWYSTRIHRKKLPPGPYPLPIIGNLHLLGNLPHRTLHKLSQKYGSIMSIRLGFVNAVIVSSPDAAKLFLGTHDAIFASRPKVQLSKYLYHGNKQGILLSEYGEYWRNIRKFCVMELLSPVKINGFAGMRKEEIGLMVEEIRVACMKHQVVNLSKMVGGLIEGMTCRMLFGKKNDERFVFRRIIDEFAVVLGTVNLADFMPMLEYFDLQGLTRSFKSLVKDIDEMLDTLITEHEEYNSLTRCDQMNFIDILLSVKNKDSVSYENLSNTFDRSTMKAILVDMVAGIIDTSKTSIEWVLSALIKHPRVMKKLQEELASVVGDKGIMVEETDLAKLSYLHMVVKETFRLYPVAPLLMPRESTEDIVINGYYIPKKTQVLVNVWAFGHDPQVWGENWAEFHPERFFDKVIDFRGPDFQLLNFSAGRRGCPAMNFGLLNVYLAVSNLVHCCDWVLPSGMSHVDLDMNEKFVSTMARVNPLLAIPT